MSNLYQDMNGTLFYMYYYQDCLHPDISFLVDWKLCKAMCNCGHIDDNTTREFNTTTDVNRNYTWKETPILVEHIREYFYCGHDSIHYRVLNKEIVEKSLFL